MSTTSQRMGLKIPDGSDPFLRTDFVQNYNTLDKYVGNWICTSTTRPTWGSAQSGMCITETDTRRTMLWTGTTWREMLYGPAVWWGSQRPQVLLNQSTMATYTIGTFTVNRPGALFAMITTEIALPCRGRAGTNVRAMIDGADANLDTGFGEYCESNFPDTSTFGSNRWYLTVPSIGVRNISAGTHSVGIRLLTQDNSPKQLKLTSVRASAMFVNASDR